MDPLVVTLAIDDESQARFDDERRRYFPPGRTQVGAHITLFHALPGTTLDRVAGDLAAASRRSHFAVQVVGLMSLGRGVTYRLASADLAAIHAELRSAWTDLLTPQDSQPFRPHITVQNKVSPDEARENLAALAETYTPFSVTGRGLDVWRYAGGPWVALERFAFGA